MMLVSSFSASSSFPALIWLTASPMATDGSGRVCGLAEAWRILAIWLDAGGLLGAEPVVACAEGPACAPQQCIGGWAVMRAL